MEDNRKVALNRVIVLLLKLQRRLEKLEKLVAELQKRIKELEAACGR